MGKLIYSGITSLDGYIADSDGKFDWAVPDEQVHAFVNDLARPIGTHLYGRRMYEEMIGWETMHEEPDLPAVALDFAQSWQAADKVVYSSTLPAVSTTRTTLRREFHPADVRQLKASTDRDLIIGGAGLAAHAIAAGLVDEYQMFLNPVSVGGGTSFLPGGQRVLLELLAERRFDSGVVFLRFRSAG